MQLTSKAAWPSRRLTKNEFRDALVVAMKGRDCWRVGKYLGSMLYFDFGARIMVPSRRSGPTEQGEAILGIRDCYWMLYKNRQLITDSDLIEDESANQKLDCLNGVHLFDFEVLKNGEISFIFSNHLALNVDTTNRYATQDCIAEMIAPDGRIYTITPRGHFYLSDEISNYRRVEASA